ncbi:TetR/AcrR family transcriptional regulator [Occultella glacieicola]|uniref:TetR/AcrR family transcriptional regulator n=1 Tax=Occultella glacieicola TaxID=2518684 RepID=A0ABY2E3H2_9MICO|nr:TetR/AcrR family transcriptional regulator [Occultella glacieicola]TDE94183.1 TetR/AcrR family transcriptional regulator [Occultella glacieicola]
MAAPGTARAIARAELTEQIKNEALRQLGDAGAGELSLRAISRELGMVSSALYRYFASRDDLLTALIVDAYADLAHALESADRTAGAGGAAGVRADTPAAGGGARPAAADPARRWATAASTLRSWALVQPHRFSLIYGTPVPGYRAPQETTVPAERVMLAFFRPLEAAEDRPLEAAEVTDPGLDAQLRAAGSLLGPRVPPARLAAGVTALAQVIGLVTLEIGGHFHGGFEPADALYAHAVEALTASLGLTDRP